MHPIIELVHQPNIGESCFEVAVRYPPTAGDDESLRLSIGSYPITAPTQYAIDSGSQRTLAEAWQWYLEKYGASPVVVLKPRVRRIVTALETWGENSFAGLFGSRILDGLFELAATDAGGRSLRIEIHAHDPSVLAWPWEWLKIKEGPTIGWLCPVERRAATHGPGGRMESRPSQTTRKVLMLSARPGLDDIDIRSVSLPLAQRTDIELTLVRPPTLRRLAEMLTERSDWDVLHLDCHGELRETKWGAREPVLILEKDDGRPHAVSALDLSQILNQVRIPHVVMNACRSAMPAIERDGGQRTLATQLLISPGIGDVVAMSYDFQAADIGRFMERFYGALTAQDDTTLALWHGQKALRGEFDDNGLSCGSPDLLNWATPAVFRRAGAFAPTPEKEFVLHHLGARVRSPQDDLRFQGREPEMRLLDRALSRQSALVVVHGLFGTGRSRLVNEAIWWRGRTGDKRTTVRINAIDEPSYERLVESVRAAVAGDEAANSNGVVLVIDEWPAQVELDGALGDMRIQFDLLINALFERGGALVIISTVPIPWLLERGNACDLSLGGLAPKDLVGLAKELLGAEADSIDGEELYGLAYCVAGNPHALQLVISDIASGMNVAESKARFREGQSRFQENIARDAGVDLTAVLSAERFVDSELSLILQDSGLRRHGLSHCGRPHPALGGMLRHRGIARKTFSDDEFTRLANEQSQLTVKWYDWRSHYDAVEPDYLEMRQEAGQRRQEAMAHAAGGEFEAARTLLRDGARIDEKMGEIIAMAMNLSLLGEIEAKAGELEAAEEFFMKALWIFELFGRRADAAITCNQWASALHRAQRPLSAGELLIVAARIFESIHHPHLERVRWSVQNILKEVPADVAEAIQETWDAADLPSLDAPRWEPQLQHKIVLRLFDNDGVPLKGADNG